MLKNYNHIMLLDMPVHTKEQPEIVSLQQVKKPFFRFKKWSRYGVACVLSLFSSLSFSLDLELTQGINATIPVALSTFEGSELGPQMAAIIKHDFEYSGQFKIIQPSSVQKPSTTLLRQLGADSYLNGQVTALGSGRYQIHIELIDTVAEGRVLVKQDFQASMPELRALAHHISDMVYEKLTGARGIFSTKIAYIVVSRTSRGTAHRLEIADADGFNPQTLLQSSEPIMSPAWSPDGSHIAYVSFEKKKAQIFIVSVANGKRRLVTSFSGINGAPAWSPDGRQLALVLSKGGSPKIYTVDLSNGQMQQLTFGDAIDTEPRFTPDGSGLLFTSGRGGSPQVYRLSLADKSIRRLTYEGNYNARASYTFDQKHLVMQHREDKNFNIAVQDSEGHVTPLTFSSFDESPSIAPNGRLVIYATRYQDKGVLGLVSLDGRLRLTLPMREGDIQEPAWSPFL